MHGPRSVGVAILSAIDIALWDLKGKALGVPVYQLLGGAFRDPVPAYSSSVYWSTPEHAVEQAQAFLDKGFKAFKVKVGLDVDNDVASPARDPRATSAPASTSSSTPTSATRAISR